MKKTLKNILLMLLALSLAFSFAGCSDKKENPLDLATKEVDNFMSALCQYDFTKMANFTDDTAVFDEIGADSLEGKLNNDLEEQINGLENSKDLASALPTKEQGDALVEYIDSAISVISKLNEVFVEYVKSSTSYEITEAKENENQFNFTVSIEVFDTQDLTNKMNDAKNSVDKAVVGESIGLIEEPEELSVEYFSLEQAYESEQVNQAMNCFEKVKKDKIEIKLTLEKQEDKWVIVTENSDFSEFINFVIEC